MPRRKLKGLAQPAVIAPQLIKAILASIDVCEVQSNNQAVPAGAALCIRQAVADIVKTALVGDGSRQSQVKRLVIERRKRCGTYGRDGLWIGLPEDLLTLIEIKAQKCHPPSGGGPPPNMGLVTMPD